MQFVLATHNQNKVREFRRMLAPLGIDISIAAGLPETEETGTTFQENAYLKAAAACRFTGRPAVADDSGLCVHALNGQPGIYSARYAGKHATDADRIAKLLDALKEVPQKDRLAKFVCVICCVFPSGDIITSRGECEGSIAFAPQGSDGFGYDPVFLVGEKTFAQMNAAQKDAVSHRGRALRLFQHDLQAYAEKHLKKEE
ncbi:MAG: XTP/dITP diphosphatase [Oscillospiraceae bacterium]|nr:XTP/dITP diphosphatase [Oscillospiraceae bacterium]